MILVPLLNPKFAIALARSAGPNFGFGALAVVNLSAENGSAGGLLSATTDKNDACRAFNP
jgi:hypothetical protein